MAHEKHAMCLSVQRCSEIERLFEELVESVGMLLPMLELACTTKSQDYLQLARETSARGTLVLKMLLWQWAGLRNLAHEQASALEVDEIRKEYHFLTMTLGGKTKTG
jgi:hypothetical protein